APAAVPVTTPQLSAPVPLPLPPPAAIAESRAPAPAPVLAAPRLPQLVRRAASPPALVVLVPVLLAGLLLWARGRWLPPALLPGATVPTGSVACVAGWGAVGAFALLSSEATAYKLGFIAIVFVGAIGLHILVNWSGELSLAHAGFIGLPAFAVAQLSAHSGVSPILVLPFGIVVGALLGLVVAIPALRARGLQVALVTLAVGIAIGQFFFVRTWVIGSSAGIRIPLPTLLGVRFETSRSLLPVLAVVVLVAVLA